MSFALAAQQFVNCAWEIPDNGTDNNDGGEDCEDRDHQVFAPPTFRPLPVLSIILKGEPFVSQLRDA